MTSKIKNRQRKKIIILLEVRCKEDNEIHDSTEVLFDVRKQEGS